MDRVTLRWRSFSSNFPRAREEFRKTSCVYVFLSSDGLRPLYIGKTKNGLRNRYGEPALAALLWECGVLNKALLHNFAVAHQGVTELMELAAGAAEALQGMLNEHVRDMRPLIEQRATAADPLDALTATMAQADALSKRQRAEAAAMLEAGKALLETMSQRPTRLVVAPVEKELCETVEQTLIRRYDPRFNTVRRIPRAIEILQEGDLPFDD